MCKHIASASVCNCLLSESHKCLTFRALQHCCPVASWCQFYPLKIIPSLFMLTSKADIQKTVAFFFFFRKSTFIGTGWAKRPYCCCHSCFCYRFAGFDEWDNQGEKWEACHPASRSTWSFSSVSFNFFQSKVLSAAPSSCHASFSYLPECRDRKKNGDQDRCPFSCSPEGYESWHVTQCAISMHTLCSGNAQTTVPPHHWRLNGRILNLDWHCLCFLCVAKNWGDCYLISRFLKTLINKTAIAAVAPALPRCQHSSA